MGADAYLQTQVMTASPYELHLMVADGAVRYAKFAQKALEGRDFEMAHLSLGKSREFVAEMIAGLKGEAQPEVIDRLKALFQFAFRSLIEADRDRDPRKVAGAVRVLEIYRETWKELGARLQADPAQPTTAATEAPASQAGGHPLRPPHWNAAQEATPRLSRTV